MVPDPGEPSYVGAEYDSDHDPRGLRRRFVIPTAGGHAVLVTISSSLADNAARCTGCGHEDHDFSELETLARAGSHASSCGRGAISAELDDEIAAVRAEMARVDPKAAGYQQQAGVLAGAGLAVLTGVGAGLPPLATALGEVTAVVVLAAVVLLTRASRPDLCKDGFGFVAHADAASAQELLARLARNGQEGQQLAPLHKARELRWLSRTVLRKYRAIRWAAPLLLAGYLGAAVTAAVTLLAR